MEEVKPKKSSFEKFVTVLNIIAIIFMIVIIAKVGIVEECTNNSYGISTNMELFQFNSKFTPYEGIRTGSQIKQLVETVNASNIENDGTDFMVNMTGNLIEGDILTYKFKGGTSKKYKVQIIKKDNIVNNIVIYDETEEIYEYEINNNTNKYKKENKSKYKIDWDSGMKTIMLYLPVVLLYILVVICNKDKKRRILKKYSGEECQKKLDKSNTNKGIAFLLIDWLIIIIWSFSIVIQASEDKPIIYIYPEEETEVTVELGRKENLICTYPIYEDKWEVTAKPDGTLIDDKTGRTYYALYWEGINSKKYGNKLENGFVVKGEDTIKFLEEKLAILGLNEKEAEEFIVYWLPKMQNNKYNYIRFQTIEEINENMPLEVTPEPDTLIRIMMEWKALNKYIEVEEQQLERVERNGYTVVEWGGTEIK